MGGVLQGSDGAHRPTRLLPLRPSSLSVSRSATEVGASEVGSPTAPLAPTTPRRRLAVGAELLPSGGAHFRVWAPKRTRVDVELMGAGGPVFTELNREDEAGYF